MYNDQSCCDYTTEVRERGDTQTHTIRYTSKQDDI